MKILWDGKEIKPIEISPNVAVNLDGLVIRAEVKVKHHYPKSMIRSLLCEIGLHSWYLVPGSEETYTKYYDQRGTGYCDNCGITSNDFMDV